MWTRLKALIDDKILRHFRESHHPVHELALGTAIGLFWALTPLVGIQMVMVALTWALVRPFGVRFHAVIGMAWVWITNPATMPVFYYTFYYAGYYLFQAFGAELQAISFASFDQVLQRSLELDILDGLMVWGHYMIYILGWPMLVGGFVVGVPVAVLGYPLTVRFVNRFRSRQARQMGLSLAEWEDRFVIRHGRAADPDLNPLTPGQLARERALALKRLAVQREQRKKDGFRAILSEFLGMARGKQPDAPADQAANAEGPRAVVDLPAASASAASRSSAGAARKSGPSGKAARTRPAATLKQKRAFS